MQRSKGTKQNDGYSSEASKPQVRKEGRPTNEPTTLNPTKTISKTTVSALGKEIDVVRTNNGHYVSRKMIDQLRANNQLMDTNQQTSAPKSTPDVPKQSAHQYPHQPREAQNDYKASRPGHNSYDSPSYPPTDKSGKKMTPQGSFERQGDHQANDSYYNPSTDNYPPNSSFKGRREEDPYYRSSHKPQEDYQSEYGQYDNRNSYDRENENSDPYGQNEEYPQDTRRKETAKGASKRPGKDREPSKVAQSNPERSDYKTREVKKSQKVSSDDQYYSEQVENYYGPYGPEKNHHAQLSKQNQAAAKPSERYQETGHKEPDYNKQYEDQPYENDYQEQDYDDPYYQNQKTTSNFSKEKQPLQKPDKKQQVNPKSPHQKAPQNAPSNNQLGSSESYSRQQPPQERDRKKSDLGGSQSQYIPKDQGYTNASQKPKTGAPTQPQKSLNVNSPPVDFEALTRSLPQDSQGMGSSGQREDHRSRTDPSMYANALDIARLPLDNSALQAAGRDEGREPSLLAQISGIVKCIKKYEDSCKDLEQMYIQSGLDLKNQLSYDYAAFSRNCLGMVRNMLRDVSRERTSEETLRIKKQIEMLKKSISDNHGKIEFLIGLEKNPEQFVSPQMMQPLPASNDVAQISSIIPASISKTFAMPTAVPQPVPVPPLVAPALNAQRAAVFPVANNLPPPATAFVQTEIIRKNLQSGAYGSYIMNPYLVQKNAPNMMNFQAPQVQVPFQSSENYGQVQAPYEETYNNMYMPQTQSQENMFIQNNTNENYAGTTNLYPSQDGLDIQTFSDPAIVNSVYPDQFHLPTTEPENYQQPEVADPLFDKVATDQPFTTTDDGLYPSLGNDFPLYGGLFGPMTKASTLAPALKTAQVTDSSKSGQPAPHETYKSLFSLFTNPAKPSGQSLAKAGDGQDEKDDISSHSNLQLYSEDDEEQEPEDCGQEGDQAEEQADELPRSLEQLLDEDSGGDAKSDPNKNDPHLPIEDISEIIPTENRFMLDSQFPAGKDFTLIEEAKAEDIPLHTENEYQFAKNGFAKEATHSQAKVSSTDGQVESSHRQTPTKPNEDHVSNLQPQFIKGDKSDRQKEDSTTQTRGKESTTSEKPSPRQPSAEGEQPSQTKNNISRNIRQFEAPVHHKNSGAVSRPEIDKDSQAPFVSTTKTINSKNTTNPQPTPARTQVQQPAPKQENQPRAFGRVNSATVNVNVISSQQAAPEQTRAPAEKNPLCSTSNNIQGDSEIREKAQTGQNRDPRVPENQDLAVPMGDTTYSVTPAVDPNQGNKNQKRGQTQKDQQGLTEGKDSNSAPSDLKREPPRETMPPTFLNDQQIKRLMDIGQRASNKILDQVSKILDSYADSKSRRKDKRSEDSFFTEVENPNGLNIYELCTSSEYSACVQRKLSRLKESERIELFYLMKPHLLKLLMDGLGKYVVHGMISMSRHLSPRREDHHARAAFVLCAELPHSLQEQGGLALLQLHL